MYPASTPFGCEIRATEDRGRGVFATQHIPAQTTIDISPVLLFSEDEYERYGKHTAVDHYTFKWRDGRMALALGLGSIFNHSLTPNVSYVLETEHSCIKFIAMRSIAPADELCIFHGSELWFDDRSGTVTPTLIGEESEEEDILSLFSNLDWDEANEDPNELIPEAELPFEKVAVGGPEGDEAELNGVGETINAWAVDIPEPRQTASMIQWLKQADLEHPSLKHAKHVRKWADSETSSRTTLLLTPADRPAPAVPGGLDPYIVTVPRFPARTIDQVKLKATMWPVFYEAQNHRELQEESRRWTRATVQWFRDAVTVLDKEAQRVRLLGEIPVVSYVPVPPDAPPGTRSYIAHDMRLSSQHPLRHAVFNLVRLVGDAMPPSESRETSENGQNYLLTSLTLFTTHEPCIACSMALLHSRVKEVVYLYAMPKTGGCGSLTCVPGLKGVNHRFKLWKWRGVPVGTGGVQLHIDA